MPATTHARCHQVILALLSSSEIKVRSCPSACPFPPVRNDLFQYSPVFEGTACGAQTRSTPARV
jgi:hypothetical protein